MRVGSFLNQVAFFVANVKLEVRIEASAVTEATTLIQVLIRSVGLINFDPNIQPGGSGRFVGSNNNCERLFLGRLSEGKKNTKKE